ncbi:TniB family NTP-binding protein [Azospirillum rugosum]|uniref:AAA+ ATPase domain-containing protein n=1 Tax=Azospirillum rugosum TaxID=416170 RepID=A0ABS4SSJ0_9PROT|nr:TniB family NTP-binding protein [Azospirillum rugosum]MBP2294355.1 hypothetical protein [Azospirillum rugosum]MDQ0527690.1 hypothetical protein [Azospirillum rugosum]
MTDALEHLSPEYRPYALLPDEQRKDWVRSDRWISYPIGDLALARLDGLLHYPKRSRMPCLLITGDTGMGKSKILEKFARGHPEAYNEGTGITSQPVLFVETPPEPSADDMYSEILQAIGAAYGAGDPVRDLATAVKVLQRMGCRLLMFDEIHNIGDAAGPRQQRVVLNALRYLTNKLHIPLVCAGTARAELLIRLDDQLAERFEHLALPKWTSGPGLEQLLLRLSSILPLRRPSSLSGPRARRLIIEMTAGHTNRIFKLIETLTIQAIDSGDERIDEASLSADGLIMPLLSMTAARGKAMA